MKYRFWVLFCILILSVSGFTGITLAQESAEEVKDVTVEVKKGEAEVQAVTAEMTIVQKKEKKTETKAAPLNETHDESGSDHGHREVGDIEVENYGIQAIFINSNVTINGGTFHGEINKETAGTAATEDEEEEGKPTRPPRKPNGARPTPPEKPSEFDKTIKDATKSEGLFTVYTKEDKVYWEVSPEQFGKDYLFSGVLATGIGEGMVKPGTFLGDTIITFKKTNSNIQLIQRNLRFTSSDPAEQEAVKKNYGVSIAASFPAEVTNPETSGYLLEMSKFTLTDFFQISATLAGYGPDRGNSYIEETKVFPENVVTRINYAFRSGNRAGTMSVPDARSLQLVMLMNVCELKNNPDFTPRIADQRIGHFIEAHIDFGDDERNTQFVRYITKWDIRKASPELELSPPVEPIVIWIEKTVPEKYRDPIRDGILEWNKAFRKIGIKDPIVVKIQPDDADWDISDIRYNTVHWNTSHSLAYGAISQWISDPRSGEILTGGFLIEAEDIRSLLNIRRVNEPDRVQMFKDRLSRELPDDPKKMVCEHGEELTDHAVFALTVLAAREGIENITGEFMEDFVDDFLFARACHEFGHVLGFRHNFEGSTLLPLDQLHNKEITAEKSISASIMDYAPVNFAPAGIEQGHYFEPTIGQYDYLAVEYAYKEIQPATGVTVESILNQIAEQGEKPENSYGTEEDLYSGIGVGIDPMCNTNDLGNDPLAYGKQQAQIVLDTIPKLPNLIQEGENYTMVRLGFNYLLNYYFDSAYYALKHIGAQYVNRVKKGGEYDHLPLEPVSAVKQREALTFITSKLFSDEIFEVEPELLNMLAAEKWYHWGSRGISGRIEYSVTNVVRNLYDLILYQLYDPITITRILDAENQRRPEAVSFTVPELFDTLNEGIWREVLSLDLASFEETYFSNKKPLLSTYRRILQRQHLKRLIEIMLDPPIGMPEDARTQAWRSLRHLEQKLSPLVEKLEEKDLVDDYSRDHLAETLAKIQRALDARLNVRVDIW